MSTLVPFAALLVLMMASNFGAALECYYNLTDESPSAGGRPAVLQLNANDGSKILICDAGYPHCMALHCQKIYGDKTVNSCGRFLGGTTTGEAACNYLRDNLCGHDPKFYCRYCDTDLCNKDA